MRGSVSALAILVTSMVASGCSDDVTTADSGTDAADAGVDSAVMVAEPTPPAAPAPPEMTPCPDGWQETTFGDATACEPWPTGTARCDFPQVRFVGEAACAPLGPACPAAGDWPADLPDDATVLFVREGATGGDGTMASPFGTLGDAIAAAAAGQTIALARGTYDGDVEVPNDVTLRGACVAGTEVVGSASDEIAEATIALRPGSTLRDLRVRGDRTGLIATLDGAVTLRNLWISGVNLGIGISNAGATVDGEGLVIDEVLAGEEDPVGIFVGSGSIADLRRVQVGPIEGTGVGANATGHLILSDAAVLDAFAPEGSAAGVAASALNQGVIELRRVLLDGSNSAGVFLGNQSTGDLSDLCIRRALSTSAGGFGSFGIGVTNASEATATRVFVTETEGSPIVVLGFRAQLSATDLVLGAALPTVIEDLTGSGVLVDTGAADLARVYVHRARNSGITVTGLEADATLRDVVVTETRREMANESGLGLDVVFGGAATVERASFVDNLAGGAVVSGANSALTITDMTVRGTRPTDSGRFGRGLGAQGGAFLSADRIAISDNVEAGVFLHGEGPEVVLRDVAIERTALSDDSGAGNGLVAVETARVDLERFRIADNALAGIQIATGARVLAREGVVSGSPIGVNIQTMSASPTDLSERVLYVDNQQNLDASELPVPAPTR